MHLSSKVLGFLLRSHAVSLCQNHFVLFFQSFFSSIICLQAIERKPLVYQPDSVMSSVSNDLDNLPDEFFEVTVDDVRKRLAMLQSER